MNNLRIMLAVVALGLIFGCVSNSFGQQTPNPPMTGGYANVSVTKREVVAAANYAVQAEARKTRSKIKLVSIKCAEQQVVAGMNYRVHLSVKITERGKKAPVSQIVEAVVYENLKQNYSLTDWTKGDCPQQ